MTNTRKIGRSRLNRRMRPRTVIPAGDSITAGGSTLTDPQSLTAGYAGASIFTAGMRYIRNAGVSGNTAAQLEARFQTDVLDYSPDATLILIGTNNLVSGMADSAYTALMQSVERTVLKALDANVLPIIVTPPPKNSAVTEAKRVQPFYYWLAEYYGLPLVDMYRLMVNPADGTYKAGYSDDGTHPNAVGIAAVYPTIGAFLSDIPSLIAPEYLAAVSEATVNNPANLIANGAFALGTSGSLTGWTQNATNSTITLEATTLPETGSAYKNVKAVAGGAYGITGTQPTVAAGDNLIFSGKVALSNIVATSGGLTIEVAFAGSQVRPLRTYLQNGVFKFSQPSVVPVGTTTITPRAYFDVVGTYQITNLTLINRTTMAGIWTPGLQ